MNILLTNDDGYNSLGINVLYKILSKYYSVYMVAPASQKSAVGHGITLRKPMQLSKIAAGYALEGTPADCIKVATAGIYKDLEFDLVVSGINDGLNVGSDVFYSGTVAGAREGLINKIPAIACSMMAPLKEENLIAASEVIVNLIKSITLLNFKEKCILNVNFPRSHKFKGIRVTHLGDQEYKDVIEITNGCEVTYASTDVFDEPTKLNNNDGNDIECVEQGFVSITPLVNEYFVPSFTNKVLDLTEMTEKNF